MLLDKDGLTARFFTAPDALPTVSPPSPEECANAVGDFWYHAIWTARKLRRGELLVAKECCDRYMKDLLMRMATWHARADHGWAYDTWHGGRFFEEWADPRIVAALHDVYANYDAADVARALWATADLFHMVAVETLSRLHYAYPQEAEDFARTALLALLGSRGGAPNSV